MITGRAYVCDIKEIEADICQKLECIERNMAALPARTTITRCRAKISLRNGVLMVDTPVQLSRWKLDSKWVVVTHCVGPHIHALVLVKKNIGYGHSTPGNDLAARKSFSLHDNLVDDDRNDEDYRMVKKLMSKGKATIKSVSDHVGSKTTKDQLSRQLKKASQLHFDSHGMDGLSLTLSSSQTSSKMVLLFKREETRDQWVKLMQSSPTLCTVLSTRLLLQLPFEERIENHRRAMDTQSISNSRPHNRVKGVSWNDKAEEQIPQYHASGMISSGSRLRDDVNLKSCMKKNPSISIISSEATPKFTEQELKQEWAAEVAAYKLQQQLLSSSPNTPSKSKVTLVNTPLSISATNGEQNGAIVEQCVDLQTTEQLNKMAIKTTMASPPKKKGIRKDEKSDSNTFHYPIRAAPLSRTTTPTNSIIQTGLLSPFRSPLRRSFNETRQRSPLLNGCSYKSPKVSMASDKPLPKTPLLETAMSFAHATDTKMMRTAERSTRKKMLAAKAKSPLRESLKSPNVPKDSKLLMTPRTSQASKTSKTSNSPLLIKRSKLRGGGTAARDTSGSSGSSLRPNLHFQSSLIPVKVATKQTIGSARSLSAGSKSSSMSQHFGSGSSEALDKMVNSPNSIFASPATSPLSEPGCDLQSYPTAMTAVRRRDLYPLTLPWWHALSDPLIRPPEAKVPKLPSGRQRGHCRSYLGDRRGLRRAMRSSLETPATRALYNITNGL